MPRLSCSLACLDQGDGNAGIGKGHRDATAHRAGAEDGDAVHGPRLGPFRNAGDLAGLALREEGITLRLGLIAGDELQEALALLLQTFVERQVDGVADGVGRRERRFQAARLLGHGGDRIGEDRAVGLGRRDLGVVVTQAAQRTLFSQQLSYEGFATGGRTLDDLLDQTVLQRFRRSDRITADDHLDRELRSNRARQALGAAGARQQAELHLGEAELGFLHRDAEMTGERDLEATAERGAVDRGHDRLR
ncbi:hypothetical protein ACVWXL_008637 [Bradyrhizobium sp. GM22.5]